VAWLKGGGWWPAISTSGPHGPALCVRRLGTLRGHRSLYCDLTLPHDNTVYAASVCFSVGNCDTAVFRRLQPTTEIDDFE
jgi:hypothetical protein